VTVEPGGDASHKYAITRQWVLQDTEDRSSGLAHLRRRSSPLVGAADMAPPAPGCAHLSGAAPTPVGGDGQLRGTRRQRVASAIAPIVKELISEFPDLAAQYHVRGVPKIVMNDTVELVGAQPEAEFVDALLRAAA
jgi:hypothetical protein